MNPETYAVILAGGKGERFWPLSTSKRPKQFLALFGDNPLLAMAVDQLGGLIPPYRVLIITSADLVEAARAAAPQVPAENVIGEPIARDTAAACALGCALIKARSRAAVFCVLTADHVIGDLEVFRETLRQSSILAEEGDRLVTIGIQPTFASTGFGYIETEEEIGNRNGIEFINVKRFVEKPDRRTAEEFLATGRYFWNSGMFIWSVSSFETALARHCRPLGAMAARLERVALTPALDAALATEYASLEKISVDYAIMQKADNIVMARGTFPWDDVGSWTALEHHVPADAAGNVVLGACEALHAGNNVVVSNDRLTALIGVHDLVVVHAGHATLICPKSRVQEVKDMVRVLGGKPEHKDLL